MFALRMLLCVGFLLPLFALAEKLTVGAEDDAAPWSYADGSGYVNDVVRAAYEAVKWDLTLEVLPYARCKRMAEDGELAACFTTSKTPQTEQRLQFAAIPAITARNVLLARSNSTLKGCDPQAWEREVSVGLVNEYEYLPAVEALRRSNAVSVQVTTSEGFALRMLTGGRVDAAVLTLDPVKRIELVAALAGVRPDFKVICDFGGLPGYIAFSRAHPKALAALNAFNDGMKIIQKDGTVTRIQRQWAQRALMAAVAKKP